MESNHRDGPTGHQNYMQNLKNIIYYLLNSQ